MSLVLGPQEQSPIKGAKIPEKCLLPIYPKTISELIVVRAQIKSEFRVTGFVGGRKPGLEIHAAIISIPENPQIKEETY